MDDDQKTSVLPETKPQPDSFESNPRFQEAREEPSIYEPSWNSQSDNQEDKALPQQDSALGSKELPVTHSGLSGESQGTNLSVNPVSRPKILVEDTFEENKNKSQKTLMFLSLSLFVFSLVGLAFYLFNAWRSGRLSFNKTFKSPSPESTAVSEPTPVLSPSPSLSEPLAGWLTYKEESGTFSFKYPSSFSVSKEGEFVVLTSSVEKDLLIKLKVLSISKTQDILSTLADEVKKVDPKLAFNPLKDFVNSIKAEPYNLFSYTPKEGTPVFLIFEDKEAAQRVFILDYSQSNKDFEDLAVNIVSSFEFSVSDRSSLSSPSPSPSTKFNIQE